MFIKEMPKEEAIGRYDDYIFNEFEWNAYIFDFNTSKLEQYNVFRHSSFRQDLAKLFVELGDDYDTFSDKLKRLLMYYFWSKCEWEIVLKPWVGKENVEEKIDVFDQILMNWEPFVCYTWNLLQFAEIELGDEVEYERKFN